MLQRLGHDVTGQFPDQRFEFGHHRLGKGRVYRTTRCEMLGRVRFLKGASGQVFFMALVLDADALGAGKSCGVFLRCHDICIARERPKPLVGAISRCPVQRRICTHLRKSVMRNAVHKAVVIRKVFHGRPPKNCVAHRANTGPSLRMPKVASVAEISSAVRIGLV